MSYRSVAFCVITLAAAACDRGATPQPDMQRTQADPVATVPQAMPAPSSVAPSPATTTTSASNDKAAPLTDQQIAAITKDANSAEIDQAKLAEQKAKDPRVKSFAAMMVKHHTEAENKQTQLGLTTASSPASVKMEKDAQDTLATLKAVSGSAFDIAYMNAQVDEHQKVADTIEHDLMPSAKNADLKAYLADIKPTVDSHLKNAKDLQHKLGETASTN